MGEPDHLWAAAVVNETMEKLLDYLLLDDRDGHRAPQDLLERDLTIAEFREMLLTRNTINVELFIRQWFRYHMDNEHVAEMWRLFIIKQFHYCSYIMHYEKYDRYRMLEKDGF